MKMIIDRLEGDIAVVELDGEMLNAPRALFGEAKEGDTVELTVLPRQERSEDMPDDESPAALFKRLRKKKKHRR